MKRPDHKRFLLVSTDKNGAEKIIFSCDNEDQASIAEREALRAYARYIEDGELTINLYKVY